MFSSTLLIGNVAAGAFTPPTGNISFVQIQATDPKRTQRRDSSSTVPTVRDLLISHTPVPAKAADLATFAQIWRRQIVIDQKLRDATTGRLIPVQTSLLMSLPEHTLVNAALVADHLAILRNFTGVSANLNSLLIGEM
jgi:hypothetical protein